MTIPLRTVYHSSAYSVSSLDSPGSSLSSFPRSTAPTTPLYRFDDFSSTEGRDCQASESHGLSLQCLQEGADQQTKREDADDAASISSIATYASTSPSLRQIADMTAEEYPSIPISPPPPGHARATMSPVGVRSMASSPADFAYYFPSTRLLRIAHADDSVDGNMNLIIQTDGWAAGSDGLLIGQNAILVPLTLFHLRMRNLKNRDFSLRRYCRESGREICHSTRRYTRPAIAQDDHFGIQHRISSMLESIRSVGRARSLQKGVTSSSSLQRSDSGYGSAGGPGGGAGLDQRPAAMEAGLHLSSSQMVLEARKEDKGSKTHALAVLPKAPDIPLPTNTTKLEFSNYLHLDLRRRGGRGRGVKRYDFEHWGKRYSWHRRIVRRSNESRFPNGVSVSVEYHLHERDMHANGSRPVEIAHIVPEKLSPNEQAAETHAGGWVPRCSMWISEPDRLKASNGAELADVIVATGLLALVDDTIKRRWDRGARLMDRVAQSLASRK